MGLWVLGIAVVGAGIWIGILCLYIFKLCEECQQLQKELDKLLEDN